MLSAVFILLATVAPAMARSYLEFCSLVDYTQNDRGGLSISALCGDDNALQCQMLNIDPCFTNSGGFLVPTKNSSGHFGSLCSQCTVGTSKSSTKDYGRLSCLCQDKSRNSTTRTSIQTGSVVNYEADSGMSCGPGNSSAAHSVACTPTMTSCRFNYTAWLVNMHQLNATERNITMGHSNDTGRIASVPHFNNSALHDRRIRTRQDEHNQWLLG